MQVMISVSTWVLVHYFWKQSMCQMSTLPAAKNTDKHQNQVLLQHHSYRNDQNVD